MSGLLDLAFLGKITDHFLNSRGGGLGADSQAQGQVVCSPLQATQPCILAMLEPPALSQGNAVPNWLPFVESSCAAGPSIREASFLTYSTLPSPTSSFLGSLGAPGSRPLPPMSTSYCASFGFSPAHQGKESTRGEMLKTLWAHRPALPRAERCQASCSYLGPPLLAAFSPGTILEPSPRRSSLLPSNDLLPGLLSEGQILPGPLAMTTGASAGLWVRAGSPWGL